MEIVTSLTVSEFERLVENSVKKVMAPALAPPKEPEPDRLNVSEAIKLTGLKKPTIYKLCFSGKLPYQKFGKFLVFSRKELEQWVSEQTKPSMKEAAVDRLTVEAQNRR